jgi:hypothetical protein
MNCCNGTNCHHETSSGASTEAEPRLKIDPTAPMHPHLMRNRAQLKPEDQKRLDELMSNVENNKPFVPHLRGDPDNRWEQEFEITRDDLHKGIARSTALIQKILKKNPEFSTLGNYWIAIIKLAVPGSKLYFVLLHCALQWFRSHATINCGGNQAFGLPEDLKNLGVCTLDALSDFSKYFVDNCEPTLVMGYTADGVGGINGNQFYCPTCSTDGFTHCPAINPIVNKTDVTVEIMTIGLSHCSKFNISVWLSALAGDTTGVNENILDKLVGCNSKSVTICPVASVHFQYTKIPFKPIASDINDEATYLRTSRKISDQMRVQSDSLARHLAKCGVYPKRSLFDSLSDNPDLPLVQRDPTSDMFADMVIKHADRGEQLKQKVMGYILRNVTEHGQKRVTSEIEDVPDFIIKYLFNHFSEISHVNTPRDVTLQMLQNLMSTRAGKASAASQRIAHGEEGYSDLMAAKREAASASLREMWYKNYPSIEAAFNNEASIDGLVNAVQRVQEVAELRSSIADLRFGGREVTIAFGCAAYKKRGPKQENPSRVHENVFVVWRNAGDSDKKDRLREMMRAILDKGLEHKAFSCLPWWEIKAIFLTVFGVDLEVKYLLRQATKKKRGVDEIVDAIRNIPYIIEMTADITDLSLSRTWPCTFSYSLIEFEKRGSHLGKPRSCINLQWRQGADTDNRAEIQVAIQKAMRAVLDFWIEDPNFKEMHWDDIENNLKDIFVQQR